MTREELRAELRAAAEEILGPRRLARRRRKGHKSKPRVGIFLAPPKPQPTYVKEFVYVIGCDDHPVKIGFSTNVLNRLSALQTGFHRPLVLFHCVETPPGHGRKIERLCHQRLANYRLSGEWFDVTPYRAFDMLKMLVDELDVST
jgi:hypothetical protein